MDAATLSAFDPYRSPKKSGIVLDWRCWVMIFVLLPSTTQARRLPDDGVADADPGAGNAVFPPELTGVSDKYNRGKIGSAVCKCRKPWTGRTAAQNESVHTGGMPARIDPDARHYRKKI